MAKAPAKKKGASRNTRASSGKGVPGWLWLMLGLALGIFCAFLWHLWELKQDGGKRPAQTAATEAVPASPKKKPAEKPAPASDAEEPRFEFYTLLPNQEVMPGKGSTPARTAPKASGGEAAYVLQAGSFKSEAEADKRRAAILLMGLPVKIVKVPVKPGEAWYRVVVGPFDGKASAQSAQTNLRSNGVEALVIKQG